ncbi:MAG TPA: sigma-70 family RNA polymerase sigma factor [Thermoanaerobaculia bacterium]|nr:sigma-70 family RNA polymerase sigma factor [Thermoanaerobaculia bacterium]
MGDSRDEELFAQLFEQARPRLRALLRLYRVASEDGEDLLQEALIALWRKRAQVRDYEAWLISALRMECLRYRRRGRRQIYSAVDDLALERLAGHDGLAKTDPGLQRDLRKVVRRLPARHQTLLHLRYGLGLTPEETADRLGYQPSSLKKTMTRCLQTLRRQLGRGPSL